MQFTHRTCGGSVFADLTQLIRVIAGVVPGKTVMRIQAATVMQINGAEKAIPAVWYCAQCQANIPQSEIDTCCENCGETIPVETAIKSLEGGGVYCSACANKLLRDTDTKVTLGKSILKKVSLNPIGLRN